jgi:O-antigen ligase
MDFFLFCLLNAVLFLRPAELVPSLIGLPIYECVILLTIAASFPQMLKRLEPTNLLANPVNLCVLGVLIAVPLSHLRHMDFYSARYSFATFGKTALYYLLFVSVIRTERRLEQFFKVLLCLLGFMTALSLLHYHEVIYLPQLDSFAQRQENVDTGESIIIPRLQSTGLFNDPNDFAMVLTIGFVVSAYYLLSARIATKPIYLLFMSAIGYALVLTKSRGGLLALFVAAGVMAYSRWGWKRAAAIGILMLPLVAAVFAMRGDDAMESGTGQSRIQLWAEGISLWKHTLTFGIGYGTYSDEVGQVAHNSFVHCFVELGLLGGTMFFGCFYFALRTLWEQRNQPEMAEDSVARRRTTLAIAILAGAATSMLSLSRAYGVPTYLWIGIGAVAVQLNGYQVPFTLPTFDRANGRKLAIATALFLMATLVFMKTMVRWS